MTTTSATAVILGVSASLWAASLWRRWLREKHAVVTTLFRYASLKYRLRQTSRLIVIADFDRTVTSAACQTSCHGVVESCAGLSVEYKAATTALFHHYYQIEICPDMPRHEKIPHMQEWYRQAHELLLKEPFTPELLESSARDSKIALRAGCNELLQGCHARGVPFILCSAGLGNVIRAVMAQRLRGALANIDWPIVSNWLLFSAAGLLEGFTSPLLHMCTRLPLVWAAAMRRTDAGALSAQSVRARRSCVALVRGARAGRPCAAPVRGADARCLSAASVRGA